VALGGGSHSDLWPQIVADVCGIPVARSTTTEATCLGAGIMAATAAGWYTASPLGRADSRLRAARLSATLHNWQS